MDTPIREDGAIRKQVYRKKEALLLKFEANRAPSVARLPPAANEAPKMSAAEELQHRLPRSKRLTSDQAQAARKDIALQIEHYNNIFKDVPNRLFRP
jgi:hypothetical protein